MFSPPPSVRFWITAIVLLGATALLRGVSHGDATVPRKPLRDLPHVLGVWTGEDHPLQQQIVQLYIGYYDSQRTGSTIHSPKNCLPGAGWDPIRSGDARVPLAGGGTIVVNEYVIQQDQDKRMVFYWYQGRGRVIASEYSGKFWMMADAISRNRTDGALVRLITPMSDGEANARARLVSFTQVVLPYLDEFIPR
jgi:EpsI family protein